MRHPTGIVELSNDSEMKIALFCAIIVIENKMANVNSNDFFIDFYFRLFVHKYNIINGLSIEILKKLPEIYFSGSFFMTYIDVYFSIKAIVSPFSMSLPCSATASTILPCHGVITGSMP